MANEVEKYIAIDPGLSGTGFSIWVNSPILHMYNEPEYGTIVRKSGLNFVEQSHYMYQELLTIFRFYTPKVVYCEYPSAFTSSQKGQMALDAGTLVKLSCFVGVVMSACFDAGVVFVPIDVVTWKGQLPKQAVQARIFRDLPYIRTKNVSHHAYDAIGLGLFVKRKLDEQNRYMGKTSE